MRKKLARHWSVVDSAVIRIGHATLSTSRVQIHVINNKAKYQKSSPIKLYHILV